MPFKLTLERYNEATVNLNSGSVPGFWLDSGDDNWQAKEPTSDPFDAPQTITEELSLLVKGTSHDSLAQLLQDLNDMKQAVRDFELHKPMAKPVCMHVQLSDESYERVALIRRLDSAEVSSSASDLIEEYMLRLALSIDRMPYWETFDDLDMSSYETELLPSSTWGTAPVVEMHLNVNGDANARVAKLLLQHISTGGTIQNLWLGIRTHGFEADALGHTFVPYFEAESGVYAKGTTISKIPSAEAFGGTFVRIPSGVSSWMVTTRWILGESLWGSPNVYLENQFGRYLWLMRARAGNDGTWSTRLLWGYRAMDDRDFSPGPTVDITGTAWHIYEMGYQSVPLYDMRDGIGNSLYTAGYEIRLQAKQNGGTSGLDIDAIVMIPVENGILSVKNANLEDSDQLIFQTYMDESIHCMSIDIEDESVELIPEFSSDGFYLPPGGTAYLILAASQGTSTVNDAISYCSITQYIYINERYHSLRGADT